MAGGAAGSRVQEEECVWKCEEWVKMKIGLERNGGAKAEWGKAEGEKEGKRGKEPRTSNLNLNLDLDLNEPEPQPRTEEPRMVQCSAGAGSAFAK